MTTFSEYKIGSFYIVWQHLESTFIAEWVSEWMIKANYYSTCRRSPKKDMQIIS